MTIRKIVAMRQGRHAPLRISQGGARKAIISVFTQLRGRVCSRIISTITRYAAGSAEYLFMWVAHYAAGVPGISCVKELRRGEY